MISLLEYINISTYFLGILSTPFMIPVKAFSHNVLGDMAVVPIFKDQHVPLLGCMMDPFMMESI